MVSTLLIFLLSLAYANALTIAVTPVFLNGLKDTILSPIENDLLAHPLVIKPAIKKQTTDMKFTKATMTLGECNLSSVEVSRESTTISFEGDLIVFDLKNVTFRSDFTYKVESNPNYFKD